MRLVRLIITVLVITQILFAQDDVDFYDQLLSNPEGNFMVFLNISSKNYEGSATIETKDLYYFLLDDGKIKRKRDFKPFVSRLLREKKGLVVCADDIEIKGFKIIKKFSRIETIAGNGYQKFLEYYFRDNRLKMDIVDNFDEIRAVSAKLFNWKKISYIDHFDGNLVIYEKSGS